jgi:glycosyltransferase A (GT-A) superfamily protein (DUF2064 family)
MKKLPWVLGLAAAGGYALMSKRLKPPSLPPEGSWKDATAKPRTNGSHPA